MNLAINTIKFNSNTFSFQNKLRQNLNSHINISPDKSNFEASMALKNQILFKGIANIQQREKLIQETIEKNSLPIKPQTLDFVLSAPVEKANLYLKYSKTGSKFFELYARYLLHINHPIKNEGELTDLVTDLIKSNNKARIINDFIPSELLSDMQNKNTTQIVQANCLNAFLGAIIYENEDGFKTAFNFLNDTFNSKIYPQNLILEESSFEKLAKLVEQKGYSWQDLYQETRFFNEQWHYRIHFKDLILSQAVGGKHSHETRDKCIKEAMQKIESGKVDFTDAGSNLIYTNYKKPTLERIEELEDFCQKWNLKFDDISLLHKVFLYGEMKDGSALAHCDTYETLEYVGDAVLGFCTHEILQNNLPNAPRELICSKRHAFVKNKNLALLAQEMELANYTINRDKARGGKRTADMFEALMGAIFINGKENGIDDVYKFLDENFRDEILEIEV